MTDESTAGDAPATEDHMSLTTITTTEGDSEPSVVVEDLAEIAAFCATECMMSAAQIKEFVARSGGPVLPAAKARAAEVAQMKADIAKAEKINPGVKYPLADAIARGISADVVAKELLEALATVQVAISPQAPAPKDPPKAEDPMLAAVAAINARRAKR